MKGHDARPECCPSSFDLKRHTREIWDMDMETGDFGCFEIGAFYCLEKTKYNEANWTTK